MKAKAKMLGLLLPMLALWAMADTAEEPAETIQQWLEQARQAEQAGRNAQALAWLRRAWQHKPGAMETGIALIQYYLSHRQTPQALAIAEQMLQHNPDEVSALRALGLAQLANERDYAATETFRQLSERLPDSPEAWYLLALTQTRLRDYEGAAANLEKALALKQDYLPAQTLKTQLLLNARDDDAALASARSIQSQGIGARLEGDIHMRQRDFARAAAAYEASYEQNPSAQTVLLLSNALRLTGRHQAAFNALRKWLAVEPKDSRVRLQLAMYLDRRGFKSAALAEYELVLESAADNVIALNNLAWLYIARNPRKSLEYAERAAQLAPQQAEILDTLGWVLVRNRQAERALEPLRKAAAQAPHLPSIRYHLALAYRDLGETDKARAELSGLLASGQAFPEREQAANLLKQLP